MIAINPFQLPVDPMLLIHPQEWFIARVNDFAQGTGNQYDMLVGMIGTTNLNFTTGNPIVHLAWVTMTGVADILLGLFIVIGVIQIMYGQSVGMLEVPVGQFIARAILTAILIHMSAFFGEQLLILNNLLCEIVQGNLLDFIQRFNAGEAFNGGQAFLAGVACILVAGISLFRVFFQAAKRVIRFNVLFVLSGPAFLTTFLPYTSSIFSIWIRMYISTIFEQFLQFLTLGLGMQFLVAAKLTGLTGLVLAAALLNMTAEVPGILSRFSATGGASGGGLGPLLATAMKVGVLLA